MRQVKFHKPYTQPHSNPKVTLFLYLIDTSLSKSRRREKNLYRILILLWVDFIEVEVVHGENIEEKIPLLQRLLAESVGKLYISFVHEIRGNITIVLSY